MERKNKSIQKELWKEKADVSVKIGKMYKNEKPMMHISQTNANKTGWKWMECILKTIIHLHYSQEWVMHFNADRLAFLTIKIGATLSS